MPSRPDEFLSRRNALRLVLQGYSGKAGDELARLMDSLSKRLAEIVTAGVNAAGEAVVSDAQVAAILREIDAEIARALREAGAQYRKRYAEVLSVERAGQVGIYSALGRSSANRVRGAAAVWSERMRGRGLAEGWQRWMDGDGVLPGVRKTASELRGFMRRSLVRARVEGWDSTRLAAEFVRNPAFQFENLPPVTKRGMKVFGDPVLGESGLLRRRAHMIARTELTRARNESQIAWAEEMGMTLYINVNAEPVAAVCKSATAAGPKTLEEWASSEGIPPRHPNCDSDLAGIPDELASEFPAQAEVAA